MKWRKAAAASILIAACSTPQPRSGPPVFAAPAGGVFQGATKLVAGTEDDLLPSVAIKQNRVVYAANSEGNLDLFVRDIDGGASRRLTISSTDDTDPAFSPEGDRIAWVAQEEDVKGDIWVMRADGEDKRRLTGRDTADAAPAWRPDGRALYFTSRIPGSPNRRVEMIDIATTDREVLADPGWDASPSPDGKTLFYVRPDAAGLPRVIAHRLADGKEIELTHGGVVEALPHAGKSLVVLARYMDDQTGDGLVDVDDVASLWSIPFTEDRFDGAPPALLMPLTAGQGGELFASIADDYFVYTAASANGLDVDALPLSGAIAPTATPEQILEASRAQKNSSLRRLGLRHVIATRPDLVATAQYEMARELAERAHYQEAVNTLEQVIAAAADTPLAALSRVEQERLRGIILLDGATLCEGTVCEALQASQKKLRVTASGARTPAATRSRLTIAEFDLAQGLHGVAVNSLETLAAAPDTLDEDRARALDMLGLVYDAWHDYDEVARVSEASWRRAANERYYADRAAARWVAAAQDRAGVPPMAALEALVHESHDLPHVAARAAVALAHAQSEAGHDDMALLTWESIIKRFPDDRDSLRSALLAVAKGRADSGETKAAIAAYERVLRELPEDSHGQARRGITALGLAAAERAERAGDFEAAYDLYERLLQTSGDTVLAQRRRLSLGARLGKLPPILRLLERDADARPRDKNAQYALGFALTLTDPPRLGDAENAMNRVLEVDPRFPAAHLTLSWIRHMREAESPGEGYLEKAADSAETARTFLKPTTDMELWAAATLNKGHALFALGKLDEAFDALMARETLTVSFDTVLQEVLFREALSRVALRVGHLDVALDQAGVAVKQSDKLPNKPREASLTGLLAALNLQAGRYAAALPWYQRAVARDQKGKHWGHLVPMLRGQAMTQQALGQTEEALRSYDDMLAVLDDHALDKGVEAQGLARLLPKSYRQFLVPADSNNISAAILGFDGGQEEELAHGLASRLLRERGEMHRARAFDDARVKHARQAFVDTDEDKQVGQLGLELVHALHESAMLALEDNDVDAAAVAWLEALPLATRCSAWSATTAIGEAWVRVRTLRGDIKNAKLDTTLREAITNARLAVAQSDAALSAASDLKAPDLVLTVAADSKVTTTPLSTRLGRVQGLMALQLGVKAAEVLGKQGGKPPRTSDDWKEALATLDARMPRIETADTFVGGATARLLAQSKAARTTNEATGKAGNANANAGAVAAGKARNTDAVAEGIANTANANDANSLADELPPVVVTPVQSIPPASGRTWRAMFDRGLADPSAPAWIDDAIRAYERDDSGDTAPELGAFIELSTQRLLARGDTESAWRLLERARLRALAPTAARRPPLATATAWERARALRANSAQHTSALQDQSALVWALEAEPLPLQRIRDTLPMDAVLVQVFAPTPITWHWFVIDRNRLEHVATAPDEGIAWPAAIRLSGDASTGAQAGRAVAPSQASSLTPQSQVAAPSLDGPSMLLLDAGELSLPPAPGITVQTRVLSATYAAVSREARSLARDGVLAAGGSAGGPKTPADDFVPASDLDAAHLTTYGEGRAIVHFAVETRVREPFFSPPSSTQVLFGNPNTHKAPLDLDALAGIDLSSAVALVDNFDGGPRAERALVQSFLMAGVPTTLVGRAVEESIELRAAIGGSADERVYDVWRNTRSDEDAWRLELRGRSTGLRFWGDIGMTMDERMAFAGQQLLRAARGGTQARARAAASQDPNAWRQAADHFEDIVDAVDFLADDIPAARLKDSKDTMVKRLAPNLNGYRYNARSGAAEAYEALGDISAAVAMRQAALSEQLHEGNTKLVLVTQQNLGSLLRDAGRHQEAAQAFSDCASLAASQKMMDVVATCQSNVGAVHQDQHDYTGAEQSFLAALEAAKGSSAGDAPLPHRSLGLLYESALTNYSSAETQFRAALTAATKHADPAVAAMVPTLLVDLARISRARGDYTQALDLIAQALHGAQNDADRASATLEEARVHWYRGNYRRAENRQQAALGLAEKIGSTFLELQAQSLGGLIDLNQGKLVDAERTLRAALALARRLENKGEEAAQLNNLGFVLREAGRAEAAEERFHQALSIDTALDSDEGRAYDLRNLALTYVQLGRHATARVSIDEALRLSRSIGNRYNELQCLIADGDIGNASGDTAATVIPRYQAAADLAKELHVPEVEWRAQYALGRLHARGGDAHAAREAFEAAMLAAEDLSHGRREGKMSVTREGLFVDAMALALQENDAARAYAYAERARTFSLQDVLLSRAVALPDPRAELQVNAVMAAREALRGLRRIGDTTPAQTTQARASLKAAEDTLKHDHPSLARAFVTPDADLATLQSRLPERHVALSYFVGPDETVVLTIGKTRIAGALIDMGESALRRRVERLENGMQAFAPVDGELESLSKLLLAPAELGTFETRGLTIIPHGPLFGVPFAALPVMHREAEAQADGTHEAETGGKNASVTKASEPLLAALPISYAVSAAALATAIEGSAPPRPHRIAALAPSGKLHFAELEARAVAGDRAFLGPDAKVALLSRGTADAIDVAAHGVLDGRDPLTSGLEFADAPGRNGRLELRTVFGMHDLPPLLTLSACETAQGSEGAEWLSLAHAFWSAGTRTVVASQGRVSDLGAALVMKHFYRFVGERPTDYALREAALTVRHDLSHPGHWANFLILGDFR